MTDEPEPETISGLQAAAWYCYLIWLVWQVWRAAQMCFYVVKFTAEYFEWFGRK